MRSNACLPGSLLVRSLLVVMPALICFAVPRAAMADSANTVAAAFGDEFDGTSFITSSGTAVGLDGSSTLTASGTAMVSLAMGTLGAEASYSASSGAISYGNGVAQAGAEYDFSVSGGPSSGTIVLGLSLDGSLTSTLTGSCGTCLIESSNAFNAFLSNGSADQYLLTNGPTTYTISIPYDPSDPPSVLLELNLNVACQPNGAAGACSVTADYLDPLQITGAQVYDTSGDLVSGAVVTSESGFNPNGGPANSTPEPSSLVLMAAGLLFLGIAFMRTRLA